MTNLTPSPLIGRNHAQQDEVMNNDTHFYSRASQNVLDYSVKKPGYQTDFKNQQQNNELEEQKVS